MNQTCPFCKEDFITSDRYPKHMCNSCRELHKDVKSLEENKNTVDYALRRYPLLIAHMICESLGYFTPASAARALLSYKENEPYFCEWYSHMISFRSHMFDEAVCLEVGKDVIKRSFELRKQHKGYMAEIEHAKHAVKSHLAGNPPILASWF